MKNRTITLDGKELPIRWTKKSSFRLSEMGFQSWDPNRGVAFMAAMISAAIDTPQRIYTAEQVFVLFSDLEDEASSQVITTVMEAFEEANKGKQEQPKKNGRTTA